MAYKIEIEGLDALRKKLGNIPKHLEQQIDGEISAVVGAINQAQVREAPKELGTLQQTTDFKRNKSLDWELFSNVFYAPYVEFGTGAYVFFGQSWVDDELLAYAATFKGKGKREVNLYPRSYFFPPFFAKKDEFIETVKTILKDL